ncbi:MAG: hypothetical protein U1F45_18805 [Burkholderiales bacterium]
MSVKDNLQTVQRYSVYGWGGLFLGTIAGLIIGGERFREWESPITTWGALTCVCAIVGGAIGFAFFKLLAPGAGAPPGDSANGDGGGDGGGGD